MKKILIFILAMLLPFLGYSGNRNQYLKVYNWSDYMDESLINGFEEWYKEQTGENVEIIYQTFDVNETMLAKIEKAHEDYDVVCPSEYIIERMLMMDLLLPLNRDFGNTPDYINGISPYITRMFSQIDGCGKDANEYSVGYMWGTMGLLYNPKYISDEEVKTWDVLKNEKYAHKILMKDAFRDIYTSFLISLNYDKIKSGEKTLTDITFDSSDESIKLVEDYIMSFKDNIEGWEADFGKEQMVKEYAWLNTAWSGDAKWAIDEASRAGVQLKYNVPETGSIVWFDGWVIPKYAKNIKAANYFINYMCMPENAIKNMTKTGYVSAVGDASLLNNAIDDSFEEINIEYFFGKEGKNVKVNPIVYPSAKTIEICGIMHDNKERTSSLLNMWMRVKTNAASIQTYIIIAIFIAGFATYYIIKNSKKKHYKKNKYR